MNTKMQVPFAVVDCSGKEQQYVSEVLQSGWLTTASKATSLERAVSELTGVRHALAVNSCTAALHLAVDALGIGDGDKVLVPSLTFTASAEVIRYQGADPVVIDVDYDTRSITPQIVEAAIQQHPDAKALVVVHFGGQAAPMLDSVEEGILSVCRRHGVAVIEDAAHAFPARDAGTLVGAIGDITCLSFYANKTMTTGEGGMLLTNSDEIAARVRLMRLHGIDRSIWDRYTSTDGKPNWEYDVMAPGFKYNMPDINAAVGLAQFERLEEMRSARQVVAERYMHRLSDMDLLDLPALRVPSEHHAWHLFSVVLRPNDTIDRNSLVQQLAERGVSTSVHYKPLHQLSYYRNKYGLRTQDYPNAEKIWQGTLSLPIFSLLESDSQNYVIDQLQECLGLA